MSEKINLHYTQVEALDFLVDSIITSKKVVALIGAGGTGKSEILSALSLAYFKDSSDEDNRKDLYFSATTNKAVSRLLEVLPEANTIHSLTTKPNYTRLYDEICSFYSVLDEQEEKDRKKFCKKFIFSQRVKKFLMEKKVIIEKHRTVNDLLASLGMTNFSKEMFIGYTVNGPIENSVLVVDEASMLPTESEYYNDSLITVGLDVAKRVFQTIILVGDSSQLEPIKGKSSFDGLDCYELTKNYRSEIDLLDAISYAREGKWFGRFESKSSNVRVVHDITDEWYSRTYARSDVAHIVYRNKTRHSITKKIRKGLKAKPNAGEPVMLRGRGFEEIQKGEIGVFNGKKVIFENGELQLGKWDKFDEYVTDEYGKYQFGYAITCHLAQGSAFDNVVVHAYDIPGFLDNREKRKWIYTAVSRARKSLTVII